MTLVSINAMLMRAWLWLGLPMLLGAFYWLLSRGGWSGNLDPYAYNYGNIGGLVPHFDPSGYFSDTLEMAFTGQWGGMASRRPVAAALRQVLALAGDYSYVRVVLIQAAMTAALLWYATWRVMIWRGAAAGFVFAALMIVLAAPLLGTFMTEPLGLMWALVSVICFIETMRRHSLAFGLLALVTLAFGMLTRMGALLLLPVFALWLVVFFAKGARERARVVVLAAACLLVPVAVNAALAQVYARPGTMSGGNFAFTVCGLTLGPGRSWYDCATRYAQELRSARSEREQVRIYLAHAKQQFTEDPGALFRSLARNAHQFVAQAPSFFADGYIGFQLADAVQWTWQLAFALAALALLYLWRVSWTERAFWIGAMGAIYVSAAIILVDDGWRALHVSHAYLILFLACAVSAVFRAPADENHKDLNAAYCAAAVAVVVALLFLAPPISYALFGKERAARAQLSSAPDRETVLAGHRLTGFLVMPDGSALRSGAIPRSIFDRMIKSYALEPEFGPFLGRLPVDMSFAFVSGPVLNRPWFYMRTYIAPPGVLKAERDMITFTIETPPGDGGTIRFACGYPICQRRSTTDE